MSVNKYYLLFQNSIYLKYKFKKNKFNSCIQLSVTKKQKNTKAVAKLNKFQR